MSVNVDVASVSFNTDGATKTFNLTGGDGALFFYAPAHLDVWFVDATGAAAQLAYPADFTIGGNGRTGTGTLTTTAADALADDGLLVVNRNTDRTQPETWGENDGFSGVTMTNAQDRGRMIDQDNARDLSKSLRAQPYDGPLAALPGADALKNDGDGSLLGFDGATGQPRVATVSLAQAEQYIVDSESVSASAAAAAESADAAAAAEAETAVLANGSAYLRVPTLAALAAYAGVLTRAEYAGDEGPGYQLVDTSGVVNIDPNGSAQVASPIAGKTWQSLKNSDGAVDFRSYIRVPGMTTAQMRTALQQWFKDGVLNYKMSGAPGVYITSSLSNFDLAGGGIRLIANGMTIQKDAASSASATLMGIINIGKDTYVEGLTVDSNRVAARTLYFENTDYTVLPRLDVVRCSGYRGYKPTTSQSQSASGISARGSFRQVNFVELYAEDMKFGAGAGIAGSQGAEGMTMTYFSTGPAYIREMNFIRCQTKDIYNEEAYNSAGNGDTDAFKAFAPDALTDGTPPDSIANFVYGGGENCRGRFIKTQCLRTNVTGFHCKRNTDKFAPNTPTSIGNANDIAAQWGGLDATDLIFTYRAFFGIGAAAISPFGSSHTCINAGNANSTYGLNTLGHKVCGAKVNNYFPHTAGQNDLAQVISVTRSTTTVDFTDNEFAGIQLRGAGLVAQIVRNSGGGTGALEITLKDCPARAQLTGALISEPSGSPSAATRYTIENCPNKSGNANLPLVMFAVASTAVPEIVARNSSGYLLPGSFVGGSTQYPPSAEHLEGIKGRNLTGGAVNANCGTRILTVAVASTADLALPNFGSSGGRVKITAGGTGSYRNHHAEIIVDQTNTITTVSNGSKVAISSTGASAGTATDTNIYCVAGVVHIHNLSGADARYTIEHTGAG